VTGYRLYHLSAPGQNSEGCAWFFVSAPELHFLWTIGAFLMVFYALSAMTDYGAVTTFAIMIALAVPVWDRHVPAETNVEDTLWVICAALIGAVITALVELAFVQIRPGDDLVRSIAERLTGVEELLHCYLTNRPLDSKIAENITRLSMRGASRLRRNLRRSSYSALYREQMGAVVALVGLLVDIAANLTQLSIQVSGDDRQRISSLAATIAGIRADLLSRRAPSSIEFNSESEASSDIPLLREMEKTVSLIPEAFSGSRSISEYLPLPSGDERRSTLLVSDALSNPDHLKFALKGCLAASLC
jgi:multidrug resistance protein MdtO